MGRYTLTVPSACANAHISIGPNLSGGGGDIGENLNVHDCAGKAGGSAKAQNVCAGAGQTLVVC